MAKPSELPAQTSIGRPPPRMRPVVTRVILFTLIWGMLTGGAQAWGIGIVTILAALFVSLQLLPAGRRRVSLIALLAFSGFFIVRSVVAGIQVAIIALTPRMDVRPVLLEFHMRLEDESERVFLASTLSLLPGTLSAGLEGGILRLHVLDERMPVEAELRAVESRVARIFCGELA